MIRILMALGLLAGPVSAQVYPQQETKLLYSETLSTKSGLFGPLDTNTSELLVELTPIGQDQIAVSSCRDDGWCVLAHRRNLVQFVNWLTIPEEEAATMSPEDWGGHEGNNAITVSDQKGGAFWPLQDGKALSWSEKWDSPDFKAQYQIKVTQTCCVPNDVSAGLATELWKITLEYSQVNTDMIDVGNNTFYYDPVLRWIVKNEGSSRYRASPEDEIATTIQTTRLKSYSTQ